MGDAVGGAEHMVRIDHDELIELAQQSTGLTDFGEDTWREPFEKLIDAIQNEAKLHTLGRMMTRSELLRCLRTRLWLIDQHKHQPDIAQRSIRQPIFIIGPSRTGTTILHELLAQDTNLRAPKAWETLHPIDRPEFFRDDQDQRPVIAESEQEFWENVQPEFAAIHELRSRLPMECLTMMAPEFTMGHWATVLDIGNWLAWRAGTDPMPGYAFHKQFLQTLQRAEQTQQWVLKSPVHLGYFRQIFQTYPDAKIIHTHRDPVKVLPSTVSTSGTTRFMRTDHVDYEGLAFGVSVGFQMNLIKTIEERKEGSVPEQQIADIHFKSLMKDPVQAIATAYEKIDQPFDDSFAHRITEYLANKPQGKHGTHRYAPEDWGFSKEKIRDEFAPYTDHYQIELET